MASGSSGRRSLVICGVSQDIEDALNSEDESFYALNTSSDDDETSSSASDSDGDEVPPAKKPYTSSAAAASSVSSSFEPSESSESGSARSSDDESDVHGSPPASPTAEQTKRGLLHADIREWIDRGCGCSGKKNHWKSVSEQQLEDYMLELSTMSRREKKMFLLGVFTGCLKKSKSGTGDRPFFFRYVVRGVEVCRAVFTEVHGIGSHVLKSLQQAAERGEVTPTAHGLAGIAPPHLSVNPDEEDDIVLFVQTFANIYGLPQPAAERGRPEDPPVYLPASHNKKKAYKTYSESVTSPVHYRSFCRIWQKRAPHIKVMKPRTDVCAVCEKHREKIRLAKTEEETDAAVRALQAHLSVSQEERQYYRDLVDGATESLSMDDPEEGIVHFTFDFAQQLELPYHTRQVGPLYFKVRYRMQLFGIAEEARKQQFNFLFHEGQSIAQDGKSAHGPNAVISMVDEFLTKYATQTRNVHFHADNCVGQNKNKSVLAYMAWRVICGLSQSIELSFMRVGHTRCAVDAYFGLIKKKFRSSDIDMVEDVMTCVSSSVQCQCSCPIQLGVARMG